MKKLINSPTNVVREMLKGVARTSPHTVILGDENVLVRKNAVVNDSRLVSVLSGGGSGHEPAHGGYVGDGMLTAAICGEVFTSPSTDAVYAAIRATSGPAGALLIVKNYTGDRLNFGLAAEMARADGIPVEIVLVSDDVSLRGVTAKNRRRGVAGTVLVHKIAGAAAARGYTLERVAALARETAENLGTMGVALDGCTLPGVEKSSFDLADDEIELGLGIHGEKGVERTKMLPAQSLTEILLNNITEDLNLQPGEQVALLVNGLGSTPDIELSIVLNDAYNYLTAHNVVVERAWSGTFLSALNMPGCSISILKVNPEKLELLDAPTNAKSWPSGGPVNSSIRIEVESVKPSVEMQSGSSSGWALKINSALTDVANALIENEPLFTELDSIAGDGDLGASMKRAAQAMLALSLPDNVTPGQALAQLGTALRRAIAGSSGPFYATALVRASRRLGSSASPSAAEWALAFKDAAQAISDLGGAKVGDRTMLDALFPASEAFEAALSAPLSLSAAWEKVVQYADKGAQQTAQMKPGAGRASYLGDRAVGAPDGGAVAVVTWLRALQAHVK